MYARNSEILALASRDFTKAKLIAQQLFILKFYASYDELLTDSEIDAVFRSAESGNWEIPEVL
jgi:predicted dehydrogenase